MSTNKQPTAPQLAREFSNALIQWLGVRKIDKINALNKAESNPSICHTHDFCDANQAMIDALAEFGVELDTQSAEQTALVSNAWAIAKRNQFNVDPPHSPN